MQIKLVPSILYTLYYIYTMSILYLKYNKQMELDSRGLELYMIHLLLLLKVVLGLVFVVVCFFFFENRALKAKNPVMIGVFSSP